MLALSPGDAHRPTPSPLDRLSSTRVTGFIGTMQSSDFPYTFPSLSSSDWLWILDLSHSNCQEAWDLTGCPEKLYCVTRLGLRPGLSLQLAITRQQVLPSSMDTPWAGSDRNKNFGAQYRSGFDSQSIPFNLATFLCTLQRGCYQTRCNTRC